MFDERNPITQSLSARYLRFARKNDDPDQPDFPVIMHSRWTSDTRWWMSLGAKRQLSVSGQILRRL